MGPKMGVLIGKNRHMIESDIGIGYIHKKYRFNKPSDFGWIPSFSISYRLHEIFSIFRIGIGNPQFIYISIDHRLY